jgi:hypothetical protein
MRGPRNLIGLGLLVLAAAAAARNLPALAPGMRDWAEPGNVAAALAGGRGFSDPFDGGTGPTAWVSPLPAWVEAAVFLGFGIKTSASATALLILSVAGFAVAHAFLVRALEPLGTPACFAASAAFLLGCTLVPGGPLEVLSEAWLDMLVAAALLYLGARVLRGQKGPGLVVVCGLAPLENAGLAAAAAAVLAIVAWRTRSDRGSLRVVLAACAAMVASVGAWTARNAVVLGRPIPLKSNAWFELHLANVDAADGLPRTEDVLRRLPFFSTAAFARYASQGELAYVESFRAPALAALRADPVHFAGNVLRRAGAALVFCRREGGAAFTRDRLDAHDEGALAAAGERIGAGTAGAYWTRIDADPERERLLLGSLGLHQGDEAWDDWSRKRLEYDAAYRGAAGLAAGFLTAGVPFAALLVAALLGRGRLPLEVALAALVAGAMVLPYVLVNHNDRHQLPLVAMQAVFVAGCVQALAGKRQP